MRYTAILFDLDGTLLNTIDDLAASVNHALRASSLPEKSTAEVMASVGSGYARLIELTVPGGRECPAYERVMRDFRDHYALHSEDRTRPYDGVEALLAALKAQGRKLAVISNKGDEAVRALNNRFFAETIAVAVGEREGVRRKPAPDAVLAALEALGVNREEAVYVGDSDVDIETARNAGIPCIAVSWGFRPRALLERCGARRIADTPEQLSAMLEDVEGDEAPQA